MDNLMSSLDFRYSYVYVYTCVRDYVVVDELFIFYGISVKLLTILSTYHSHCLFIIRMLLCIFTCQFLNHVSDVFLYTCTHFIHTLHIPCCKILCAISFFSRSILQSFRVFLLHPLFHFIFFNSMFFFILWCVLILVLIIALWSVFANLHLDLPNNCQFYSINCNHFSKLYMRNNFLLSLFIWWRKVFSLLLPLLLLVRLVFKATKNKKKKKNMK